MLTGVAIVIVIDGNRYWQGAPGRTSLTILGNSARWGDGADLLGKVNSLNYRDIMKTLGVNLCHSSVDICGVRSCQIMSDPFEKRQENYQNYRTIIERSCPQIAAEPEIQSARESAWVSCCNRHLAASGMSVAFLSQKLEIFSLSMPSHDVTCIGSSSCAVRRGSFHFFHEKRRINGSREVSPGQPLVFQSTRSTGLLVTAVTFAHLCTVAMSTETNRGGEVTWRDVIT